MKKMTRSLLLAFLVVAASASSCKKDDDNNNNNNNTTPKCYVTKVYNNNIISVDFLYNESNQVKRIDRYSSIGKLLNYYNYEYSNGQVSKITLYDGDGLGQEIITPTYNSDGTLKKVTSVGVVSGETNTIEYTYNGNKQATKATEYNNGDLTDWYQYTYDANNAIKIEKYTESGGPTPDLLGTEEITYDSKNNGFNNYQMAAHSQLNRYAFLDPTISSHNIVTYTSKDQDGSVTDFDSYTNTFSYTASDYPQTAAVQYGDNTTENLRFDYDCK